MTKKTNLFFAAIVLGLGWAMRGHFGHEWGASWAGAMGALAVLVVSKRKDWALRAPALAALGAIGWGAGGMMSYGIVIGYCQSISFVNSLYGYVMLAVIGGLYGFIGGGLFGLGLESSEENKPKWSGLIIEMFVGGFLVWGLLIYQMEWFMTPPRSELWAGCLGAALALGWYLYRNNFKRAVRVASYAALGAGFGFAFGNFIQTVGSSAEIQYNWWNVMEFTLGFFGGLGMIYAVLTREWPKSVKPSGTANWIAIIFLFAFIPATNYFNGFSTESLINFAEKLNIANPVQYASRQLLVAGISIPVFAILAIMIWNHYSSQDDKLVKFGLPVMLFITTIHYNFFAYIRLGTFYKPFSFKYSESLYLFIVAFIFTIWYVGLRKTTDFPGRNTSDETWKRWGIIIITLLITFVIITTVSINIHSEMPGAHDRF
ncbi:MAG: hypothetical protein KAR19_00480 [Bacteroidales bacterium]|nr:hypothetical protein [Bacteroidales bacterium]